MPRLRRAPALGLLLLAAACSDQVARSEFTDEPRGFTPAEPGVGPLANLPRSADASIDVSTTESDAGDAGAADHADAADAAPFVPSIVVRAGTPGGDGNIDGVGAASRLHRPYSVAVDGAGNVYVADQGNDAIRKIAPDGVVTTFATSGFRSPSGIAVDSAGNVYVADTLNQTIRKITADGVVSTLAGSTDQAGSADGTGAAARFNYPAAVAVDGAGVVFVADSFNHTIRKITPEGVVTTIAGSAGASGSVDGTGAAARFGAPEGVAVDGLGNVYVGDTNSEAIRKITSEGVVTTLAGSLGTYGNADGTGSAARFWHPGGLSADAAGNVFVGDTYNQTVRKITPAGVVTTIAGAVGVMGYSDGAGSTAHFDNPKGTAVDSAGNVYLADYGTNTVRKISPSGLALTIGGAPRSSGNTDGTGAAARFDFASWQSPTGVVVDSAGSVFVADSNNNAVRKVTAAGVVTTLASGLHGPTGVARDDAGNVYVADTNASAVLKITPAGLVSTIADSASGLRRPSALTIDSAGTIIVADNDFFSAHVRRIDHEGVVTTLASGFRSVGGLAVDATGTVFATDMDTHVIQRISSTGEVTLLAGTEYTSGNVDGTGAAARFARPKGITRDPSGNLFVADANNYSIRRITPEGVVTTVAGTAGRRGTRPGPLPGSLGAPSGLGMTPSGNLVIAVESSIVDVLLH